MCSYPICVMYACLHTLSTHREVYRAVIDQNDDSSHY